MLKIYCCSLGHSFRRTSASLLANAGADILTLKRHGGWKSNQIAESYIEDSLTYKKKTGNLIASSINLKKSQSTTSNVTSSRESTACINEGKSTARINEDESTAGMNESVNDHHTSKNTDCIENVIIEDYVSFDNNNATEEYVVLNDCDSQNIIEQQIVKAPSSNISFNNCSVHITIQNSTN